MNSEDFPSFTLHFLEEFCEIKAISFLNISQNSSTRTCDLGIFFAKKYFCYTFNFFYKCRHYKYLFMSALAIFFSIHIIQLVSFISIKLFITFSYSFFCISVIVVHYFSSFTSYFVYLGLLLSSLSPHPNDYFL